jgi:glycosyltransferase involved in cell wall biosynthesis
MISVVTCTYNTPHEVLARTWASLRAQTHLDWEWVVFDDSPGWETWRQLYGFCADERYNVRIYRPHTPSGGNIGKVKHDAFMLARGDVIVELDHDDELTADALEWVVEAFNDLEVGFAYSDWCEILPDGQSGRYPDGWAFGYGDHYWDHNHGVWAMRTPPINSTTLRHIVSVPNHLRAWRSSVYRLLEGHDVEMQIADDYELIVRTVLSTQCHHIERMLYKQHIGAHTAQRQRNQLIQTLVQEIAAHYDGQITAHFSEE